MAEERANIEEYMSRFGLEEKEAQVAYHLESALDLLSELYENGPQGADDEEEQVAGWFEANIMPHYIALWDRLARRVLARDYPQSWWGDAPNADEEDYVG